LHLFEKRIPRQAKKRPMAVFPKAHELALVSWGDDR
jgi:hypothetical protein